MIKAEIVFLYAWDVAYEIPLAEAARLLDRAGETEIRPEKAAPRDIAPERALALPLPPVPCGDREISASANLYSFGVISITLRYRIAGDTLAAFVPCHDPRLPDGRSLDALARQALDGILARVGPKLKGLRISPETPEAYTVFRFAPEDLGLQDADRWLEQRGRDVAALLTAEADPARLSDSEVAETLRQRFSYYRDDLVVIDWEAALVVEKGPAEDVLRVIELANLQVAEYRHYDLELDRFVTRAYDDLEHFYRRSALFFSAADLMRKLRSFRVSLSEVAEEIENATKFIGDWHLARLYLGCATRFHIQEWKASVEEKLRTLDELYNLVSGESSNRKMLVLETLIVLLFIVDLVLLGLVSAH